MKNKEEIVSVLNEMHEEIKKENDIDVIAKLGEKLRELTGTTKFKFDDCISNLPPERNEEGFRIVNTEVILLRNADLNLKGRMFLEKKSTKDLDFMHFTKGHYLARMSNICVFTNRFTGAQKMLKCRYA